MNFIVRKASVRWKGGARGGTRVLTTGSGVLKRARFSRGVPLKNDSNLDPPELIAAAYAGSFSAALSNELGLTVAAAGEIVTTATVAMENLPDGWTIVNIHVNVVAKLRRMTQGRFIDATVRAKTNCVVSRLLRATISMNAKLEKQRGGPGAPTATRRTPPARRR